MSLFKSFVLASVLVLVAACGFQPLYGNQTNSAQVTAKLAQTYVLPIEDRLGQIVRNQLIDKISPAGLPSNANYTLKVSMTQTKSNVAIDQASATNRVNMNMTGNYALYDRTGKKPLFKGSAFSIASYNVVTSDFANLSAEKNASKRAAIVVSEEIHRQLSVFFSR
jgi:LPS-assembly lipoprotein